MAVIKHIAIKNSNSTSAVEYLTYKHDEFTSKPILDEQGCMVCGALLAILCAVQVLCDDGVHVLLALLIVSCCGGLGHHPLAAQAG